MNQPNIALHKWCSNNENFFKTILKNDFNKIYDKSETNSNKVLGISWSPTSDYFTLTLPRIKNEFSTTKREVLSEIAQLFDPLGFIAPIIIVAKIWLSKIDWDDKLNSDLLSEWTKFISGITISLNFLS